MAFSEVVCLLALDGVLVLVAWIMKWRNQISSSGAAGIFAMAFVVHLAGSWPLAALVSRHANEPLYVFLFIGCGLLPTLLYAALLVDMVAQMGADGLFGLSSGRAVTPDFSRARALQERGDTDGALRQYRLYFQENPTDPRPLFRMVNLLMMEGRDEDLISLLREIQNRFRSQDEVWARASFRLAEIYRFHLCEPEQAYQILQAIISRSPYSESGRRARQWVGDMIQSPIRADNRQLAI